MPTNRPFRAWLLAFAVTLGTVSTAYAVYETFRPRKIAEAVGTPSPMYRLKEHNGRVAVFRYRSSEPLEILDTHVDSLPEHDRAALKKGVDVYSQEELQNRIEDYDS